MRVLMLVIRYDTEDWATNFIPKWVAHLAAEMDTLDVLALHVGAVGVLPPNVRVFSMGKERGAGRLGLLAGFYRHALRLLPPVDAVFVHMIPRYALLVAPVALAFRKPITLWYTHRHASPDLKRALPLVARVVTADASSFPLQTDKLRVLGHGIDTNFFTPPGADPQPRRVVQVARLQAIKNQDKLLAALAQLPGASAQVIGDVHPDEDPAYSAALREQANSLGERVQLTGGLPAEQVRAAYRQAAVAVNLSPPGLFDKAALESMACGVPTLVCSPAFDPLLGPDAERLRLAYPPVPSELAARLAALFALPLPAQAQIGAGLRERVHAAHSLDALAPRLAQVLSTGEPE